MDKSWSGWPLHNVLYITVLQLGFDWHLKLDLGRFELWPLSKYIQNCGKRFVSYFSEPLFYDPVQAKCDLAPAACKAGLISGPGSPGVAPAAL